MTQLLPYPESVETRVTRIEERLVATKQALELQAGVYEERLRELNGAHAEALRVQHRYVTQEKYDDRILHSAELMRVIEDRILALEKGEVKSSGVKDGIRLSFGTAVTVVTLFVVILGVAVAIIAALSR